MIAKRLKHLAGGWKLPAIENLLIEGFNCKHTADLYKILSYTKLAFMNVLAVYLGWYKEEQNVLLWQRKQMWNWKHAE